MIRTKLSCKRKKGMVGPGVLMGLVIVMIIFGMFIKQPKEISRAVVRLIGITIQMAGWCLLVLVVSRYSVEDMMLNMMKVSRA